MDNSPRIVVVGAGAIGSSVAGWIKPYYRNTMLLARGSSFSAIKKDGLCIYSTGKNGIRTTISIPVIESLKEIPIPLYVIITVKNYDLEATARTLSEQLGNQQPIIVALQNGVLNQQVLPKYFNKIIYGVVSYNAWKDQPGVVGSDSDRFITLGTPDNSLRQETQEVAKIFQTGFNCTITDRLLDAAHCKLIVNLGNAAMTLIGFKKRPIKSFTNVIRITTQLLWEGVQVLQAAGFKEHPLGKIPSWRFIKMGTKLPPALTSFLFRFSTKKIGLNSMSQDIFGGKITTELESLNGYMLGLAKKVAMPMPINQTIYDLAKERFGPNFEPITESELWHAIETQIHQTKGE